MTTLEARARELLESVQVAWEEDLRWSEWLASEGERVRDNAQALVEAASTATLQNLVGETTVHEYLGYSWLEVHSISRERADARYKPYSTALGIERPLLADSGRRQT